MAHVGCDFSYLGRLVITRTHFLEWVTAQAEDAYTQSLAGMYRRMGGGIVLAIVAACELPCWGGTSPGQPRPRSFSYGWSLPSSRAGQPASTADRGGTGLARRCQDATSDCAPDLAVFETFVSPEDHALPLITFKKGQPRRRASDVADNIGLYLLSTLAAVTLVGWAPQATERLEATLATMNRLVLFHGHFYNWYDTHPPSAGSEVCVLRG